MKTLGQIACETFNAAPIDNWGAYPLIEANWQAAAQAVRAAVIEEVWNSINSMIVDGPIQGNGWDLQAQRNGVILAANKIQELR